MTYTYKDVLIGYCVAKNIIYDIDLIEKIKSHQYGRSSCAVCGIK